MALEIIRIRDLRNLTDCELLPHEGVNLVHGANASGKTSLLEAIYILGRGRSFRDKQLFNAVQRGKDSFTVFGKKRKQLENSAIGVSYSKRGASVRIDGEKVAKLSILAKETPIHIVTPRSQEIIENGSAIRRRFLDWGVFHVEPLYQHFYSRYQRALFQRNMALRTDPRSANLWNRELVDSGSRIEHFRELYFSDLKQAFFSQLEMMDVDIDLELSLYRGWSSEKSLLVALETGLSGDENRKFTRMGPHRADIIFRINHRKFDKWGSRGQLKLVVLGLFFAQAKVIESLSNKEPILLVDDFAAELDKKNAERVLKQLIGQRNQMFITTTDRGVVTPGGAGKMFHVEHGVVSEQGV